MTAPHPTTLAAALMTSGGAIWSAAMSGPRTDAFGGAICSLHARAQAGVHCGWCYAALALMAAGAGLLAAAGLRALSASAQTGANGRGRRP